LKALKAEMHHSSSALSARACSAYNPRVRTGPGCDRGEGLGVVGNFQEEATCASSFLSCWR
jgi:hypothetical protein